MERSWCQEGFAGGSHCLLGHAAAPGRRPHRDAPRRHLGTQGTWQGRAGGRAGTSGSWHLGVPMATGLREHLLWRDCPACHPGLGTCWAGQGGNESGPFLQKTAKSRGSDLPPWPGTGRKAGTDPHGAGTGQETSVGRSRNHPDLLQKMSPARAAGEAELVAGG